jgi:hypothetical protein
MTIMDRRPRLSILHARFHRKAFDINETSSKCFTSVQAFGQRGTHLVAGILGPAALRGANSADKGHCDER